MSEKSALEKSKGSSERLSMTGPLIKRQGWKHVDKSNAVRQSKILSASF